MLEIFFWTENNFKRHAEAAELLVEDKILHDFLVE